MIWMIADTHFDDPNTFMYSRTGDFSSLSVMNEEIKNRWNDVVGKKDKVFHLGDIGRYKFLNELNGEIIVILGNHDNGEELSKECPGIKYYDRSIFEDWLILSHKPIEFLGPQTPYLNIHGHLHNFVYGNRQPTIGCGQPGDSLSWYKGNRYFCVSCEAINYMPISLDKIVEMIQYKSPEEWIK